MLPARRVSKPHPPVVPPGSDTYRNGKGFFHLAVDGKPLGLVKFRLEIRRIFRWLSRR
jgi:hypothetical protein